MIHLIFSFCYRTEFGFNWYRATNINFNLKISRLNVVHESEGLSICHWSGYLVSFRNTTKSYAEELKKLKLNVLYQCKKESRLAYEISSKWIAIMFIIFVSPTSRAIFASNIMMWKHIFVAIYLIIRTAIEYFWFWITFINLNTVHKMYHSLFNIANEMFESDW